MGPTVLVDGAPVAASVAAAFAGLTAEFKQRSGRTLHLSGPVTFHGTAYQLAGIRTWDEQNLLYQAYLAGQYQSLVGNPNTPSVTKHLDTVARALDVEDDGPAPGVRTIGSPMHTLLLELLPKHGFIPAGDHFSPPEGWHIEWTGPDPYAPPPQSEEDPDMAFDAAAAHQLSALADKIPEIQAMYQWLQGMQPRSVATQQAVAQLLAAQGRTTPTDVTALAKAIADQLDDEVAKAVADEIATRLKA